VTSALVEFAGVSKSYGGLRPLRIADLRVAAGEQVAILGFDQATAEVFVSLATGATLPDAGEVRLLGRATSTITDSADWLAAIDRLGIVSDRTVLLEQFTVIQNLVIPFTLQIEPPPDADLARAEDLAREVGLADAPWTAPLTALDPAAAARVRVGRAIALDPAVLLLEHATAQVPRELVSIFGADIRRIADRRGLALVAATADEAFATAVASRVLTLEPSTGKLRSRGRSWFRRS